MQLFETVAVTSTGPIVGVGITLKDRDRPSAEFTRQKASRLAEAVQAYEFREVRRT